MECEDKAKKQVEMVATLQSRRDALEAKIRQKNEELKVLCIQEAELTGTLPPEIPLEPGESPPPFRRRMGTAFLYPENLINKLKSKEEESLANLELECKIQTNIAEAALRLANDGTVSKAVRRKHRLMYQQSQRRLHELEAKLNLLRQTNNRGHMKQRKKPRPPLESENDCVDGSANPDKGESRNQPYHPPLSYTVSDKGPARHSFPVNNFNRIPDPASHRLHGTNYSSSQTWQQHYIEDPQDMQIRTSTSGQINREQGGTWCGDTVSYNNNNHPRLIRQNVANINEVDRGIQFRDRFGSLDRRRLSMGGHHITNNNEDFEHPHHRSNHVISTLPPQNQQFQISASHLNSVLLPNQTYPENSLMRTQSLGSVELSKCEPDTRSLKSNLHHNYLDSMKPEPIMRHAKSDFYNHNYLDQKYQSDSNSLKSESTETFNLNLGKYEGEPEFPKKLNSQENLKYEHNPYPNRMNTGHHHLLPTDHMKHDLKTVVEGSTLNSYLPPRRELEHDMRSMSIDPSGDFNKHKPQKPEPVMQHHDYNNHHIRHYNQRYPEPPRPNKYSSKPELRPPVYREERLSCSEPAVQKTCSDSHLDTSSSEIPLEPLPKKFDTVSPEFSEVVNRKTRDKEWYETSLDSRQSSSNSQTPPLPPQFSSPPPPPLPPPPRSATPNCSQQTTPQPVEFDTVVPFESPKNHTVVQAGKWQPYREVTKPFEMADFYKYSTKFRNKSAMSNPPAPANESSSSPNNAPPSPQQKGVYKPLKSMTCQPIINNPPRSNDSKSASDIESPSALSNSSQVQSPPSLANAFSTEMLAWYQDQSNSQSRSATLV